jgi:aspartate racemase
MISNYPNSEIKKIGIVGGISWTSTIDYYRIINEETNKRLGALNFAECIIYSVNFENFTKFNAGHRWNEVFKLISDAALQLKNAGADVILLGANTAHIVSERVSEKVGLPLIDIRVATANAIHQKKLRKVGLLGTVYTMELDFYKDKLSEEGIETIIPGDKADREFIEYTLLNELGKGILVNETKTQYIGIIEKLIRQGAEGIILGCTEIPLLIKQEDIRVPVFNTTQIHAQAAVEFACSLSSDKNFRNMNYTIQHASLDDFGTICQLFDSAISFQKENQYIGWNQYDEEYILQDIHNKFLFKVMKGDSIVCIFSICFKDQLIWRDKEKGDAIYLHRIVLNQMFKGEKAFKRILDWSKAFAAENQLKFIRMDTWADNEKLISYYKTYGFTFIENYTTPDTKDLPAQHRNLKVGLLQLSVETT